MSKRCKTETLLLQTTKNEMNSVISHDRERSPRSFTHHNSLVSNAMIFVQLRGSRQYFSCRKASRGPSTTAEVLAFSYRYCSLAVAEKN